MCMCEAAAQYLNLAGYSSDHKCGWPGILYSFQILFYIFYHTSESTNPLQMIYMQRKQLVNWQELIRVRGQPIIMILIRVSHSWAPEFVKHQQKLAIRR